MKKITIIVAIIIVAALFLYGVWYVYNQVATSIIEREIREAGLNPEDYNLRWVMPWNVREFVTRKEIEKAGLNPDDYTIKGELTADEVRLEVIRQEITRQLAEYDLTINDIDLTGIDLLKLTPEELSKLIYDKAYQKVMEKNQN